MTFITMITIQWKHNSNDNNSNDDSYKIITENKKMLSETYLWCYLSDGNKSVNTKTNSFIIKNVNKIKNLCVLSTIRTADLSSRTLMPNQLRYRARWPRARNKQSVSCLPRCPEVTMNATSFVTSAVTIVTSFLKCRNY